MKKSGLIAVLALLLVLALELLIIWHGPVVAPGYLADLRYKEPDTELELTGFYIPEANAEFPYRWSQPYAFVQLPNAPHLARGYVASFRMRVPNPEAVRPVTILVNEQPQAVFSPTPGFRHYHFALPVAPDSDQMRVALSTTELRLPGDVRPLGLVFTEAKLRPILGRNPELMLLAGLGMLLVIALSHWRGAGLVQQLILAAVLGFGMAAMLLVGRPAALSLMVLFVCDILAVCVAMVHRDAKSCVCTTDAKSCVCTTDAKSCVCTTDAKSCVCTKVRHLPIGAFWGASLPSRLHVRYKTEQAAVRVGLVALMQLPLLSAVIWSNWLTDDAFISFRYAQNLAQGHGLVYNLGERVEGYTNFLWTILAALVIWLGGDIAWWAYAAGMVLALLIVLLSFKVASSLLGEAWGLVAALIVATNQGLLIYTARGAGLETGLFTFLMLAGLYAGGQGSGVRGRERRGTGEQGNRGTGERRRGILAGLLFGLATLTRPEGALIFGICWGFAVLARLQSLQQIRSQASQAQIGNSTFNIQHSTFVLTYIVIVLPYFLWRLSYYGDLLPNTFYAKTGGGSQAMLRGLEYAAGFGLALGGPLLLFALVPVLAKKKSAMLSAVLGWPGMLMAVCLAYTLYIIRVGGDHFPGQRFFVPLVPWLAVLMAAGMARCYVWLHRSGSGLRRRVVPLLLAVTLISYAVYALFRAPEQNQIVRGSNESLHIWQELGWWMADNTASDESIAVLSAGAIAFYSERTTIDMLGLTDKHIGRLESPDFGSGPAGHEKRDPAYVLERKPTYIPAWWDGYFGGADVLRQSYDLMKITTRYGRVIELWRRR